MTAEPPASPDALYGPEPLGPQHDVAAFACGVAALDDYLRAQALVNQRADKSRTYVVAHGAQVVAYFSLSAAAVEPAVATARLAAGQGRQAIPVILLARLAVDTTKQGRGLGEAMLVEALARSAAAAGVIGARAVVVHATDESARGFYAKFGFEASPTNTLHLILLMKNIRKSLKA